MKEELLHTVWQFQYFSKEELRTSEGLTLQIIKPGLHNCDAGPDFAQAHIVLDGVSWYGDVEIHVAESQWFAHNHQQDAAYNKVILHVVLTAGNRPARRADGTLIPTLVLDSRIDSRLLQKYQHLSENLAPIPCQHMLPEVSELVRASQWERALLDRLARKSSELEIADTPNWQQLAYTALAKAYGFNKNGEATQELARRLPYALLAKHLNSCQNIEALLYGASGLLPASAADEYSTALLGDWQFFQHKYSLQAMPALSWKFHRMRPANFPTVRLAQLAAVLHRTPNVVNLLLHAGPKELIRQLQVPTSTYWQQHYHFGRERKKPARALGKASAFSIIINAVAPFCYLYGQYTAEYDWYAQIETLLENIPAERNSILKEWETLGVANKTSRDSQALLEQFKAYCRPRRCLQCRVGQSILRPTP